MVGSGLNTLVLAGLSALALGPSQSQGFGLVACPPRALMNQLQRPQHRPEGLKVKISDLVNTGSTATWCGCGGVHAGGSEIVIGRSSFLPVTSLSVWGCKKKQTGLAGPRMGCVSGPVLRTAGNLGKAAAVIALRGGGAEHNVISGVLAELGNIRTPAALLGGAALGTMFVQRKPGGNKRLHLLYTMLSTAAFTLQLICVLCSTLTYTAVASRSEALASSTIAFLSEQMKWEFYVIRGSFIFGLFCFLGALSVRGWMTFSDRGDQASARAMMIILGGSAIFLLNFIHYTHNSLTLCLGGMTKTLVSLTLRNMYSTKKRFIRHSFWLAAIWGGVKVLKLGPNQGVSSTPSPAAPSANS